MGFRVHGLWSALDRNHNHPPDPACRLSTIVKGPPADPGNRVEHRCEVKEGGRTLGFVRAKELMRGPSKISMDCQFVDISGGVRACRLSGM